jgi:autotransporter-associated beta strand protein
MKINRFLFWAGLGFPALLLVILTSPVSTASAATRTWSGAGTNNLWSNGSNWVGNAAPTGGDMLLFPVTAARRNNTNDIAAGTTFAAIAFATNGYTLNGNLFTLTGGIAATNQTGGNTINNNITFNGSQMITNAALAGMIINGAVSVTGTLTLDCPGSIIFFGFISGTGGFICRSANGVVFNNANSYGGTTEVQSGTLSIGYSSSLGGPTSSTTVRAGATLYVSANITVSESLVLEGNLVNADDVDAWTGPITINGTNATITVIAGSLDISGPISGTGSVTLRNFEGLQFNGISPYSGDMRIAEGTVLVNGQQASSRIVLAGGTLGGSGHVGNIISEGGGTVSPGASTATLSAGTVALTNGVTFIAELNGTTAGSGYDQLVVQGSVTLGGSLVLSNNFNPPSGTVFTIINNDNVDAVNGTFAGLPEGATFTNGTLMRISYVGGTGNDVTLATGCPNPCNLRLHDGPTPYWVYVRWDTPLGPVQDYFIYRNGLQVGQYAASDFLAFPLFFDARLQPNHSYTYQVIATYSNGSPPQASNPLLVVTPPPTPVVGTNNVVNLLVRFADFPDEPYTTNFPNAEMFTNQFSVSAYYREASYGKYILEGSTHGWYTLPGNGSNYCAFKLANGLWYGPNFPLIIQDTKALLPPAISNLVASADIVQYLVHGLGTVGLSGGATKMYSATNGFGVGTVLHEISHGINFYGHSGSWNQPPGGYSAGPDLLNPYLGGGSASTYGDWYDPLGGGASVHHSTYFKEHAGWLETNNIQWIDHDGDYNIWAIEKPTNKVQMLKFNLGNEMFYFFEYRTITSFDGPNTPSPGLSPFDGVLGRLRLSFAVVGDMETLITYPKGRFVPQILNPGTPFLDPYRSFRLAVISKSNGVATVRVSGVTNDLRLTNIRRPATNQNVQLTFNSIEDARYLAEATTNFLTWQTVRTNIVANSNSTTTITTLTNAATSPMRFFRIGVDTLP